MKNLRMHAYAVLQKLSELVYVIQSTIQLCCNDSSCVFVADSLHERTIYVGILCRKSSCELFSCESFSLFERGTPQGFCLRRTSTCARKHGLFTVWVEFETPLLRLWVQHL